VRGPVTENKTGNGLKAAFLAAAVLATAGVAFYFSTTVNAAKASVPKPSAHQALSSRAVSLPLFFEPNQGQTDPRVKFLARGAGYGLFLTSDEAVLELHRAVGIQHSAPGSQRSALSSQRASSSVIRMRLDGANSSARVSGASPLPGKSNYFIGNDPSKWRHDIPQFARVEHRAVYPGVDLVYYGDQGQLEYDFRVAPTADPNQIALSFQGASARIDSGDSGDLILSTANGDVRFHAPRVYQQDGNNQKTVAGNFRQIADNKIGFTVGAYDHSRELVIDPVLTYSTYIGGENTEQFVHVAIGPDNNIYLVGSTNSPNFPLPPSQPNGSADPPVQSTLNAAPGATNIFIAVINPTLQPPNYQPYQQLIYATYLGGSGTDNPAGVAVHTALDQLTTGFDIFVAGSTTSTDFPINGAEAAFESGPGPDAGTHGFLARVNVGSTTSSLRYSTYLAGSNSAGNATDIVTGMAIDAAGNAYVTGDTTSTNPISDGFPANPNGFQRTSNSPGNPQFFASEINTTYSGFPSMIYSTFFGGSNPAQATANGGGIAVDPTPSNVNMYITGETNMLPTGLNGGLGFPLFNAQQSCLNEPGNHGTCTLPNPTNTNTDAFIAKINPNQPGSNPIYSTYIGGGGTDAGKAIAVDTSGNAYVTGSTDSTSWGCNCSGFEGSQLVSGATNAFIAKLGNLTGSVYPLNYFTYLGGSGPDSGQDIKVDSLQAAHVAGTTESQNPLLPVTSDAFQPTYGGGASDAFVALISTTSTGGGAAGDYVSYLGGSGADQGTGIALDAFNAAYVAGDTQSTDFPTKNPLQPCLNNTAPVPPCPASSAADAFVSEIGAASTLTVSKPTTSPSPNPVAAGTQVAFTFDIINTGPDTASDVTFYAIVPTTGLASNATAKVTAGSGTCGPVSGTTIVCNIPTLAACTTPPCGVNAAVEVDVTPSITAYVSTIPVSGYAVANGATSGSNTLSQLADVVDFTISASTSTPTIYAGDPAVIQVEFCPTAASIAYGGYSASITPSQSTSPSMVTATTPTFLPTPVVLSGTACQNTALSIQTVARPVTTGMFFGRSSFYAAWLPIGGLSLAGLGIGVGRKRRRWLAASVLGLIAGVILLQSACGSSSTSTSPGGGTQAAYYTINITGSAATGAAHSTPVYLTVH